MDMFKQVYICIKGQKMQTLIVAGVIFLASTLVAGALLVNQAIENTDKALRALLPAVGILEFDEAAFFVAWQETGSWPESENMTTAILHEIGTLSDVRSFNFTVRGHGFYSEILERVWHPEWFTDITHPVYEAFDWGSLSNQQDTHFERFLLNGVGSEDIFEVDFGIIDLIEGRTFTPIEIQQGMAVAVVSEHFLMTNNLRMGDILLIDHIIKDYTQPSEMWFDATTFLAQQTYEFEIIGIFNRERPQDRDLFGIDIDEHHQILNEIFVPAVVIENAVIKELEVYRNLEIMSDDMADRFYNSDAVMNALDFENMYFLLYDPLYLQRFHDAVNEILPEFWMMNDYTFAYRDIARSMDSIKEVADSLLLGGVFAMLIILNLVIILFLRSRRQEMGIYLALGKGKIQIFFQFLLEIIIPILIAMSMALFVGSLLADHVSGIMLLSHMEDVIQNPLTLEEMQIPGFRHGLINEEMMEMFKINFDIQTIFLFYGIGLSVLLLTVSIAVFNTLKMNPKDILVRGEI